MDILYEDNHIIVCYKPKGILSQQDHTNGLDMVSLLKDYIKEKYNKPGNVYLGLVHRLDRNTSGIMVFAKTSKAAERLSKSIQNHRFEKRYYAVVEGKTEKNDWTYLTDYMSKDENKQKAYIDKAGKEAVLEYKELETKEVDGLIYSLEDIKLHTGRYHQIRLQFSNMKHPLYGDVLYGGKKNPNFELGLQAYHLEFEHPTTHEMMVFEKYNNEGIFKYFKNEA